MRNHLTKFKAIDFISHIYHNLITTLSQPYRNLIATLSQQMNDRSSQLHFNKLLSQIFNNTSYHKLSQLHFNELLQSILRNILRNKLSDVLFITNIQRIFLRNDLANYSSQTFQQTMIHFYITNIHNRRVGYKSFITSSSWLSDRSSLHSFNKFFIISLSQNSHNNLWYNTLSQNFQNNLR